jgi:D-alanine-D-alanine ligase
MKKKVKLGIIFYGREDQKPINLWQYRDLKKALVGFEIKKYDFNRKEHYKLLRDFNAGEIDVVLKNSYGRGNEAEIESFLELNHIPYLGSNPITTFIGTNKFFSKKLFREYGLLIINDVYIDKRIWKKQHRNLLNRIKKLLGFPCIVKAVDGTDSRNLYFSKNKKACEKNINKILNLGKNLIVEKYIDKSYEVTCLVTENRKIKAFEPVGIINRLFSAKVKDNAQAELGLPCKLNYSLKHRTQQIAIQAHLALDCRSFSRADFLIKGKQIYLLEVDVHPGFRLQSPTTLSIKYEGRNLNDLFLNLSGSVLKQYLKK